MYYILYTCIYMYIHLIHIYISNTYILDNTYIVYIYMYIPLKLCLFLEILRHGSILGLFSQLKIQQICQKENVIKK